jgi:hypothetical protein
MATGADAPDAAEDQTPYAGHSGGAFDGTPTEGQVAGGSIEHGLSPGGVHRGKAGSGQSL